MLFGEGGFGHVYKIEYQNQQFAIKIYKNSDYKNKISAQEKYENQIENIKCIRMNGFREFFIKVYLKEEHQNENNLIY